MAESPTSVADILTLGSRYLQEQGIAQPHLLCEMLLACLLQVPRLQLALMHDQQLRPAHLEAMRRGLKRLRQGEPIQYVLGETGFMDHVFKTDRRALIPRPETEELVRTVLNDAGLWQKPDLAIADVGTGTGCIALSLAAKYPQAKYLAVDPSADAISLARENAERLQLTEAVLFFCGYLEDVAEAEMFDAIIANLPYIDSTDMDTLPDNVRNHEPHQALDGGKDGLECIATLIADASILLKAHGKIFLEIGEKQGRVVRDLLQQAGFSDIRILQDTNQRDRIACGVLRM